MTDTTDLQSRLPALAPGRVAVVTGGASGIGLAAARRFAALGMKVVIADRAGPAALDGARRAVEAAGVGGRAEVRAVGTDVARFEEVERLRDVALDAFGAVNVLMNNAGAGDNPGGTWTGLAGWRHLIDINFWGVVHGVQAFVASMTAGAPGLVINTGSKQGITTPPGNPAYNVSKAAVKAFTEALAHELRNTGGAAVTAHLLIPGFTFTGLTGSAEKPPGAWTADQVIDFMLESLLRGDFYILCPDNEVRRPIDEKRMAWAIGDLIHNRPALSRWHPDFKEAFARFMEEGSARGR
jgi:NAD(P)-dependent dehydrogenase (short-subunit alcohol dehydrogenase family)